ncbi:hypothetical protein P5V15_009041 [Pogonomyrmex californicus]
MENLILEKHPNENYKQDIKYVTKQNHILLRILGIWPLLERGDLSVSETICKILLIIICCTLICFEGIPSMLYCLLVPEGEPGSKLKMIAPTVYSFTALAKYGALIVYENEIRSCLRHIKDDWRFVAVSNARDIMLEKTKVARSMFTICCVFLYCAGLSYQTIVPLSRGGIVTHDNVTIRPLAYAGYFVLFDEQRSPAYEIVFTLQFFGGFVMYSVTIVTYGLAALFVMHACAQMKILMMLMEDLVDERVCKEKTVDEKLIAVVERQIRIRNFLCLAEDTLQKSSLFEILGNTIMMCFVGYCILMEWRDGNTANVCTFLVALASDTVNIFLLCYIGEHITATADEVALKTNMLEWYRLPAKRRRYMVLIIIMSHIPSKITAGKFIVLSLKTFGDVMKSAVVYFNILRTVAD